MTASSLRAYSIKDLAQMAKRRGVAGWDAMRKDQLVRALSRAGQSQRSARVVSKKTATPTRRAASRPAAAVRKSSRSNRRASVRAAAGRRKPRMLKRLEQVKAQMLRSKDLAGSAINGHFTTVGTLVREASCALRQPWDRIGTLHTPSFACST
jgi:hypothetical protein